MRVFLKNQDVHDTEEVGFLFDIRCTFGSSAQQRSKRAGEYRMKRAHTHTSLHHAILHSYHVFNSFLIYIFTPKKRTT